MLIVQRLASIEIGLGVASEVPPFAEFELLNQGSAIQRDVQGFAFEEELSHSWVYKRSAVRDDNGQFSIITSAGRTASWSMLSGLSLADNISTIAVQALPIYEQDLSNSNLYDFGDISDAQTIVGSSNPSSHKTSERITISPRKSIKSWWSQFSKPAHDRSSEHILAGISTQNGSIASEDTPGVFGIALSQSIVYANVAISLVYGGKSYIYGYIPIVVAKTCIFVKRKGVLLA